MESNTINERIQQIVDELFNGNKAAFAKAIGKAPTTVANILGARKTTPSSDFVESIKNSIENINLLWLMTGVGEMLIADDTLAQAQELKAGQPEEIEYEYGKHDRRRKAVFHPLAKAKPQKQRHGPEGRGPAKVQQTGPLPVFGGIFGAPPGRHSFL